MMKSKYVLYKIDLCLCFKGVNAACCVVYTHMIQGFVHPSAPTTVLEGSVAVDGSDVACGRF